MPEFYSTGTVSVPAGSTTVTLADGLWSGVLAGDTIEIGDLPGKTIASPTDATHLELAVPVTAGQVNVPYVLRFDAPSRFTSGYLAEQVRALIAQAGIIKAARPNYEVQSLGSNAPPGAPVTGDLYVVGTAPTGIWAGRANNLAQWTGSAWLFTAADHGTSVVSVATGIVSIWNGTAWTTFQTALGFAPVNKAGDTMSGRLIADGGVQGNNGIATATLNLGELEVQGNGIGAAAMAFHRPGGFAAYFGLDTDNAWKVGGGSYGAVAHKIYHAASIVGTVSQSGGTPTGAIVERGSNASGEFVRFADGTQICWRTTSGTTLSTTTVANGLYRTDPFTVTFPASFAGVPFGIINIGPGNGWMGTLSGVNTTQWTYQLLAVQAITSGATNNMQFLAVGRWF
jgi:hypothetical protein